MIRERLNIVKSIVGSEETLVNVKSPLTVLCYIKNQENYLMLHRTKKEEDINKDKWIGVGGHFESMESPQECLIREVKEETGLTLLDYTFRGIVTFVTETGFSEYMCLYEGYSFEGELIECNEGVLEWVSIDSLIHLNLWEGDYIFLDLLKSHRAFFSLKLEYNKEKLVSAILDHKELELFDICDEEGVLTGKTRWRKLVHQYGTWHRTSHVWIVRKKQGLYEVLLQKRSKNKDAYPGCYDISSAGHITAGGDFLESAVRELYEELGILAKEEALIEIGIRKIEFEEVFEEVLFIDRQISKIFILEMNVQEKEFVLQTEEVEQVMWIEINKCIQGVRNNQFKHCIFMEELEMVKKWCDGANC